MIKPSKMWAIYSNMHDFFYTGTCLTRSEIIKLHTTQLGKSWDYCRKKGDRAIKVEVRATRLDNQ